MSEPPQNGSAGPLKGVGVWSPELRAGDHTQIAAAATELEALGYTALWLPQLDHDLLPALERILDATSTVTVATGILSIYELPAPQVSAWWATLPDHHQQRLLLGLGVSHRPVVGDVYAPPLQAMTNYLDKLDDGAMPAERRVIAAQGPKMLDLARRRTAGAHPYLVTPEHTRFARSILGAGALLAPEQGVLLETDSTVAREIAREQLSRYWRLPNYVNNWLRLGFTEADVTERSDRLVDALIVWGSEDDIVRRIQQHLDAGADHVCIKVIQPSGATMPLPQWRSLSHAVAAVT